jgi:glycosyltransferase involved in cell wall biosynthesis
LILVTSNWVKEMYVRDGIRGDNIEVLPVGIDTDEFKPFDFHDEKIASVRKALGILPHQLMILTVGGDAASKGAQEVFRALAMIDGKVPEWRYVCKVWPQSRTDLQNSQDFQLIRQLGLDDQITYVSDTTSRNFMPYLIGACDIYAAPSRLEGFGMPQVEAGACAKPVISINAMGMLDTLLDGETALLANVAQEITTNEVVVGEESGFESNHRITFPSPRIVEYRANVEDIANHLLTLMNDPELRQRMGNAGREHVIKRFDYRVVAEQFVQIVGDKLGIR